MVLSEVAEGSPGTRAPERVEWGLNNQKGPHRSLPLPPLPEEPSQLDPKASTHLS